MTPPPNRHGLTVHQRLLLMETEMHRMRRLVRSTHRNIRKLTTAQAQAVTGPKLIGALQALMMLAQLWVAFHQR